jgi:hypothetical protein
MFAVSLGGIGLLSGQGNQFILGSMRLGALIPFRKRRVSHQLSSLASSSEGTEGVALQRA